MATDFTPMWVNKETLSHQLDLCEMSCSGTGRAMVHLHFIIQPQGWAAGTKGLCSSHHWAHTWLLSGMTYKFAWSAPGRPTEVSAQHLLALGPLGFYSQSRGVTPLFSHIHFRLDTRGIWNIEVWKEAILVRTWKGISPCCMMHKI